MRIVQSSDYLAEFKNDNNWVFLYQESREVVYDEAGGYTPMAAFEIPITFDNKILAVRTLSKNAKYTWRFSGVLTQRMQLGGGATPLPLASFSDKRMRVNRSSLIYFLTYGTDYELLFEPYYWIKHIDLSIWGYVGDLTDSIRESINQMKSNELANIETKLDEIATYNR